MVVIIVISTSCSGIFYINYACKKFIYSALAPYGALPLFEFLPGINSVTNALTLGIYFLQSDLFTLIAMSEYY